MATIAVAAQQARNFRNHFSAWRRKQGAHIYAEPQESAGVNGAVDFSSVPTEFLNVLDAADFKYAKISS